MRTLLPFILSIGYGIVCLSTAEWAETKALTPVSGPAKTQGASKDKVIFHALGSEPGWYVDVVAGKRIVAVTDYGEKTNTFPFVKPAQVGKNTVYRSRIEKSMLRLIISPGPCYSMSDQKFENTVRLDLNGKTFHGCGSPPHKHSQ